MTVSKCSYLVGGLEPWNFMTFPSYWEWNNDPNGRVFHHFSEGFWYTTNQLSIPKLPIFCVGFCQFHTAMGFAAMKT